jgi:MFS family permease
MQNQVNDKNLGLKVYRGLIICIIAALFYCYEFILRILPGILHSELSAKMGNIPAAMFGQIAALYYFAYSPMQLPVGMLMDRFGPRRLLSLACFCCTLGSYLFGYSDHLMMVGIGRFLVGFGSAFAFVGVLTLSTMWLPKNLFSLFAGIMTTMSMLGNVYAEIKITSMTSVYGLNSVLMAAVALGGVLTLIILVFVRDNKEYLSQHHVSLSSFFKEVMTVIVSYKVWIVGMVGALLYTSLSVFGELWGQSYLEQAHHLSKMQSAQTISMLFIGWAVGAPLSGYLSDKFAQRIIPLMIGAIGGLLSIASILYLPNLSYTSLKVLILAFGLFTSTEILVFAMAKEISGSFISGTVFAVTNMIVTLLGALLQPSVGWLLDYFGNRVWSGDHYVYQVTDYQYALSILPISMSFVILLLVFGFKKS